MCEAGQNPRPRGRTTGARAWKLSSSSAESSLLAARAAQEHMNLAQREPRHSCPFPNRQKTRPRRLQRGRAPVDRSTARPRRAGSPTRRASPPVPSRHQRGREAPGRNPVDGGRHRDADGDSPARAAEGTSASEAAQGLHSNRPMDASGGDGRDAHTPRPHRRDAERCDSRPGATERESRSGLRSRSKGFATQSGDRCAAPSLGSSISYFFGRRRSRSFLARCRRQPGTCHPLLWTRTPVRSSRSV